MAKIILCCRDSLLSIEAIEYLLNTGFDIPLVIVDSLSDNNYLSDYLKKVGIPMEIINNFKEESVEFDFADILISFLYPCFITDKIIKKAKYAINFHPAPLPEYRGCATTSHGILQEKKEWAVTCHFITDKFDEGDIVERLCFEINSEKIKTGMDLSLYSREKCLELLKKVIGDYCNNPVITGTPQSGGRYYSKRELSELLEIKGNDTKDTIDKKINAFWYPPYEGAYVVLDGKKFYLINEDILKDCIKLRE